MLATLAQACRDAYTCDSHRTEEREEALAWLRSGEPAELADAIGLGISQKEIDNWLAAGCPPGDDHAYSRRKDKIQPHQGQSELEE